jgi:hypothetical protein
LAHYGAARLGAVVRTTSFSPQELLLALLIWQVWQTNGIEICLSDAMVFADLKKGHLSFQEVIKLLAKQGTEIVEWDFFLFFYFFFESITVHLGVQNPM